MGTFEKRTIDWRSEWVITCVFSRDRLRSAAGPPRHLIVAAARQQPAPLLAAAAPQQLPTPGSSQARVGWRPLSNHPSGNTRRTIPPLAYLQGEPSLPLHIYKENHPSPCVFTRRTIPPLVYLLGEPSLTALCLAGAALGDPRVGALRDARLQVRRHGTRPW